jgi:hypothetical protein
MDARAPPEEQRCAWNATSVVFLDGDGSDCPEFMNQLVDPIVAESSFVIGCARAVGANRGSMNLSKLFPVELPGG